MAGHASIWRPALNTQVRPSSAQAPSDLNGDSWTWPVSTASGWCSSIHFRSSGSPYWRLPSMTWATRSVASGTPRSSGQDVGAVRRELSGDARSPEGPIPPGANGHQSVAELDRVAVGRQPQAPDLVQPQRRLFSCCVCAGEVVVPPNSAPPWRRSAASTGIQGSPPVAPRWAVVNG